MMLVYVLSMATLFFTALGTCPSDGPCASYAVWSALKGGCTGTPSIETEPGTSCVSDVQSASWAVCDDNNEVVTHWTDKTCANAGSGDQSDSGVCYYDNTTNPGTPVYAMWTCLGALGDSTSDGSSQKTPLSPFFQYLGERTNFLIGTSVSEIPRTFREYLTWLSETYKEEESNLE
jgi:hypothetical protein